MGVFGMSEEVISNLINRYNVSCVECESFSSEYNLKLKRDQRLCKKHVLCDELLEEIGTLNLSISQKDFVHYLVDFFSNDFKNLHGRAKQETIILVFIFYVKKLENSHINLNNYSVSQKYNLNDAVFKLILCRMCDSFIKFSYLQKLNQCTV